VIQISPAQVEQWRRQHLPKFARHGEEWRGPCPVHQGKRESFALNAKTGQAFCHSECNRGWSLVELHAELTGCTLAEAAKDFEPTPVRPRVVAEYPYVDADGKLLYQVVRMEPKDFRQRRPDGKGSWVWDLRGVKSVLYRLPRLGTADRIFIVEGEKDVHTLERWGLTATCNSGGAGKWKEWYGEALKGKQCVILPDNDEQGRRHAAQVSEALQSVAADVRVIHLPDLAPKGDVSDWVAAGGKLDDLLAMLDAQPKEEVAAEKFSWEEVGRRRFQMDEKGISVHHQEMTQNGPRWTSLWICTPVQVVALTRNADGGSWGKLVEFRSIEGALNRVVIQQRLLLGDGKEALEYLADRGFRMSRGKKQQEALKDFLHQAEPDKRIFCCDRVGWHGRSYVLPDQTFSPPGEDEVIFDPSSGLEHKYNVAGSIEDWRAKVAKICEGNALLVFAVSAAFAAPLLRRADIQGGGFHFVGLSSTGKTTAIRAAGSVWGGARDGSFLDTWRATANGIEAKGMAHNDALLCLDEIDELAERDAYQTIYMLANGGGKARMTRGLVARRNAAFCTLFLSTGERTVADVILSAGRQVRGGQEARLIQIHSDAGCGMGAFQNLHGAPTAAEFSRWITSHSRRFYGRAIRLFLAELCKNLDAHLETFRQARAKFMAEHVAAGSAGEVFRAGNIFAAVAAAGQLASQLGVTGWMPIESPTAAAWVWSRWIEARGGAGAQDISRGVGQLENFLLRNGGAKFEELDSKHAVTVIDRAGFREYADGGTRFLMFDSVMNDVLRGYDLRAVLRAARDKGVLETTDADRLMIQRRLPGLGRTRVYSLLLRDGGDEDGMVNEAYAGRLEI
jgi:putative DNA primase/helicase